MVKKWMQRAVPARNEGKFTKYCGGKVTNECIRRGMHSPSAHVRHMANFARTARRISRKH